MNLFNDWPVSLEVECQTLVQKVWGLHTCWVQRPLICQSSCFSVKHFTRDRGRTGMSHCSIKWQGSPDMFELSWCGLMPSTMWGGSKKPIEQQMNLFFSCLWLFWTRFQHIALNTEMLTT